MSHQLQIVILCGVFGVLLISSAASAFQAITVVGPYMKACWRVELNSFAFFVMFALSWDKHSDEHKIFIRKNWITLIFSGVALAAYFSLWTLSLDITSVAHSLLFLSSTPLLIAIQRIILRQGINLIEIIGVIVGFFGMMIICYQEIGTGKSTWYGDLAAFGGAFAFLFHIQISEHFVSKNASAYFIIVYLIATITCFIVSLIFTPEDTFLAFAYFYEMQGLYAAYSGLIVGFLGNGLFYYMLVHVDALLITVILNLEPVAGSIFAWACGFQDIPTIYTWIGGAIMILGNFLVTIVAKLKSPNPHQIKSI